MDKLEQTPAKSSFSHYIFFLFGQQFSMLGSLIVGFVFIMFIPQIVVTPFAGVLSDRWNKKALIPVMVPKDNLSRVNGFNFLFSGLIYSIGPIIAATLLEFFKNSVEQIFFIDIITFSDCSCSVSTY